MAAAQSPALSEAKPTSVSNSATGTASELSGFPHYKELHKYGHFGAFAFLTGCLFVGADRYLGTCATM